jgi:Helicase conserved C-terminal domain
MNRGRTFETIWREEFDPTLVHIPREEYRTYVPLVNMYPLAVYDEDVIRVDDRFKEALSLSFNKVNKVVTGVRPRGIGISMRQLIKQIPLILSGAESSLRVFIRNRLAKQVPVDSHLKVECRRINSVILERLLLFEDLPGIMTADEFDDWADSQDDEPQSSSHVFRRGEKLSGLLGLLERESSEKVAIFVRNIPVCESVCEFLLEKGFKATFLHGGMDDARQQRLEEFKTGITQILVVTRQLFGRGFDLPQADKAIFYSPKQSAHVMWQEMLRIRSTGRKLKTVFVLFYAWTAEHTKMMRLLAAMFETGAKFVGGVFRWSYSQEEEPLDKEDFEEEVSEQAKASHDFKSATKLFVAAVIDYVGRFAKETAKEIEDFLRKTADDVGFSKAWPLELVETLFRALSVTIERLRARNDITRKRIKNDLAKVFHPDKHAEAVGTAKDFWHELSVNINL